MKPCMIACTSVRTSSASPPALDAIGVVPLVMDAGETFDTAALAGSTKSVSSRPMSASASASRTSTSADGSENRISSSVRTAIFATLAQRSVTRLKSNLVIGFGAPSPTQ